MKKSLPEKPGEDFEAATVDQTNIWEFLFCLFVFLVYLFSPWHTSYPHVRIHTLSAGMSAHGCNLRNGGSTNISSFFCPAPWTSASLFLGTFFSRLLFFMCEMSWDRIRFKALNNKSVLEHSGKGTFLDEKQSLHVSVCHSEALEISRLWQTGNMLKGRTGMSFNRLCFSFSWTSTSSLVFHKRLQDPDRSRKAAQSGRKQAVFLRTVRTAPTGSQLGDPVNTAAH